MLIRWPILVKRPLNCRQLEDFIRRLGIEIWETELTACHGLATSFELKEKRDNELIEAKDVQDSFDEPALYRKDTFWSIVELLRRGGGKVILLRPGLSEQDKTYILGHELGHHLLGHIDGDHQIESWLQELHADIFSYWLTDIPSPFRTKEENFLIARLVDGKTKEGGNHE